MLHLVKNKTVGRDALDRAIVQMPPQESGIAKRVKGYAVERQRMQKWFAQKVAAGRSVEIVTLTPVLAEILLEHNTKNRPIAQTNVISLKRENAEGRFLFNGESISVTASGVLGDGQHRCEMVIETGKPIEVVMVFGIEEKAVKTINLGRSRTAANVLAMDGVPDANAVATTANLLWQWRRYGRLAFASNERPTKTQVIEAAQHLKGIAASIEFCKRKRSRLIGPTTLLAFCHYAFKERASEEAANAFMLLLIDGGKTKPGDPVDYVRHRLIEIRGWVFPQVRASLIFQAWNLWRRGEKANRLHVNKEALPQLEG